MPTSPSAPPDARIYVAPPNSGDVVLGRTLVSLLDEAVSRYPNARAFNEKTPQGWQPLSNAAFLERAENLALGLLELGFARGEHVGFYTDSDLSFALPDMACLLAGLIDVPIYLTHPPSAIAHILRETGSRLVVCSSPSHLAALETVLPQTEVDTVLLWRDTEEGLEQVKLPSGVSVKRAEEVEALGASRRDPARLAALRDQLDAQDLATILYTSGTTGTPKGVMLTHENISFNAIAAITGLTGFRPGAEGEVAISFLPLSHIFARTLNYCLMWYGVSTYYSDPNSLSEDFKTVRPTFFASVPRVLERAYERILAAGEELTGTKRAIFDWALELAQRYHVESPPTGLDALPYRLADRLVYAKWRAALGGRIKQIIVGGAALRGDLVEILGAAGISVLQGYGLTETSPVITYNRPGRNRPGTVGLPLAGVEVKLSPDGEILTRGPHVMKGYFRRPEETAAVIDEEGWFHTGDLGEMSEDGYLTITGRVKNLFKLSTGKFVMPQPLEERLEASPLIDAALIVGEGQKFCAAMLFLNEAKVRALTRAPDAPASDLLASDALHAEVREVFREASREMPAWSTPKRAALLLDELSIDRGFMTPTLKVMRPKVQNAYAEVIQELYSAKPTSTDRVAFIDL